MYKNTSRNHPKKDCGGGGGAEMSALEGESIGLGDVGNPMRPPPRPLVVPRLPTAFKFKPLLFAVLAAFEILAATGVSGGPLIRIVCCCCC